MAVDALIQLKVTSSVCSFFAILATVSRLYLRREKFWWDDACAFLSTVLLLVQIASVFMHLHDPHVLSRTGRIAAYYIMAIAFYLIIWTARLSILYSIIRIDPNPRMRINVRPLAINLHIGGLGGMMAALLPQRFDASHLLQLTPGPTAGGFLWSALCVCNHLHRQVLHRVAVMFIIVMLVMCAQLFWVCEPLDTWKNTKSPQCPLTKQVAICQLVTDILADLLLILAPLRLLQQLSAQDGTRRRLMIIFSTSIVTTIVSLVHAALILTVGGIKVVIAAIIEDTFSLIVCNVPVVVTFILRHALAFGVPESRRGTGEDHGGSTFGWWRTNAGAETTRGFGRSGVMVVRTVESDTAENLTTVNLWELPTKAPIEGPKDYDRIGKFTLPEREAG